MKRPQGYCKGCPDRVAEDPETGARDCHITCERYKRFKAELAEWHREYYERKRAEALKNKRPWLKRADLREDKDHD